MDTDALRLLMLLDRLGSMSAVARSRDVAVSTIARRLEGLEAALGLRLLDRRASGVRLSADGARIAAMAPALVDQAARIERTASALKRRGTDASLTISATEFIVTEFLAPALPRLWASAPGLAVTLKSQGEVVSLAERAADIAIRMGAPHEPTLVGRRIGETRLGCFASPDYLAGRDPGALAFGEERLLAYDDSFGRIPEADWITALGLDGAVMCRAGSTRALIMACAAGGGIALLPERAALRAGLIRVAAPVSIAPRPIWVVTHRDLSRTAAVRAAMRWIVAACAELR